MKIPEKTKAKIEAVLELIRPESETLSARQEARARKHIHAAILTVSLEARAREKAENAAKILPRKKVTRGDHMRMAATVRWAAYAEASCGKMDAATFRRLGQRWKSEELGELLGVSASTVYAYRRLDNPRRIPNVIADKLLALCAEYNAENVGLPGEPPPPYELELFAAASPPETEVKEDGAEE